MSKEQVFDRSKYISGIDPYDKKETLEEATERLQKDKYGIFISKDADVKGQLVIDTANAAFLSGMIEGAKWQQEQMEKLKDFDAWKEWKNKT
jgi:hypothetical protein